MDILDADDEPLRHSQTRKLMQRDIVQFVPFNEFKDQHISVIAKETLEEVPGQVQSFMSMHNITPNPPKHAKQPTMDNMYAALSGVNYGNEDDMKQPPAAFDPYSNNNDNPQYSEGAITNQNQKQNQPGYNMQDAPAYNPGNSIPANPYYGAAMMNNGNQ